MLVSLLQPSPEVFECFDGEAGAHGTWHPTRPGRQFVRAHGRGGTRCTTRMRLRLLRRMSLATCTDTAAPWPRRP